MGPNTRTTEWSLADDDLDATMGPASTHEVENGAADVQLDDSGHPPEMATTKAFEDTHTSKSESARERQVKPNKVYIGGLPDHTRPEDLRNCFGKIGDIVTIQLKLGYGFVEFDTNEAALESVARYHEGYFMGNKIKVELSHSRGRTFKRLEDPGACYSCGESGHWARECPQGSTTQSRTYDQSSHDRGDRGGYSNRHYNNSAKETHSYRDEYSRHAGTRDDRQYDASMAPPPPPRDHRRAATPPRERRDDPPPRREYDDHRTQKTPSPPPVTRYERTGHHDSERDYSTRGAPSHRDSYDRHDRRHNNSDDKGAAYTTHARRPRTPPGPPPATSGRDEYVYDKPSRGHYQAQETHRRAATPQPPFPGGNANGSRYRRRSQSPARYDTRYGGHSEGDRYSTAPREGTRVRDYHHRSGRGEDSGHRRS